MTRRTDTDWLAPVVMRAPHTPRKRMVAQANAQGLYEYRPQSAEDMA